MKQRLALAVSAVLTTCLALLGGLESHAQSSTVEYQVKAAFLYNFAKFVDWPSAAFGRPDDPFTICLAGDPFAGALEKVIQGEALNGRRLAVRRIAPAESIQGCQIMYVDSSQDRRYSEMNATVANAPILTVGET